MATTTSVIDKFVEELKFLTKNDSDRIRLLTMIALENKKLAKSIVDAIEKHVRACRPECKLWGLYLLDSISKTSNSTYNQQVGRNLREVFLSAYEAVDSKTKLKLDKLLHVWQKYGRFDGNLLRQIERGLGAKRAGQPQGGGGRGGMTPPSSKHFPHQQQQQQQMVNPELLNKLSNFLPQFLESQSKGKQTGPRSSEPQRKIHQVARPPAGRPNQDRKQGQDFRNVPDLGTSLLSSDEEEEEEAKGDRGGNSNGPSTAKKRKRIEEKPAEVGFSRSYLAGSLSLNRHEDVINSLYFEQTHQCMQTGKRFREKKKLQRHMDVLFFRKKLERESELSRKWYVPTSVWVASVQEGAGDEGKDEEMVEEKTEAVQPVEEVNVSVVADPNVSKCALSGEKFDVFYNEDDEQWHFRNALRLKMPYQGLPVGTIVLRTSLPEELRSSMM
ncbi:hypothetical protein HOP50_16g78090 [Chloropicon primus]|uniref:CID domain-containing protein n=2 Tax=Chloropicon primus TaxID=1764295 RepID=A0A5B8MZY7_9CHLO|nr:hypothetical protein A3770_16p77800 [Chloropicon primus]UPR04467.1 hypothetical protein HOP50_16g78090 [Chloropicon primus]|eukprot:QDZ25262.1 hypothetical protein A3770_16p77800 [Chloropicon primus]